MIWIIGGTSEASELATRLKDTDDYIITVATEGGLDFLNTDKVYVGRLSFDDMIQFATKNKIDIIVDLSHPYATIVSDNARKVSEDFGIKYIRYVREKTDYPHKSIYLNSYEECYEYLKKVEGTVFFTTGSKNIGDFEKVRGDNRYIYRMLPAAESLEICHYYNIPMKDILAILGPFTVDFNKVMLSEYNAKYCVMKDSGKKGGTREKLKACGELDIVPIIIGRQDEEGIDDLEEVIEIISDYV